MAKNIVIGVGNILFKDDGIGVVASKYLSRNFEFKPQFEILDGGTLGFDLIEYFVDYDNVFIIDTISSDEKPGTIYKIPSKELLGGVRYKNTAHEVEVVQMLEASELYDKKAKTTIFGIVPEDILSIEIGLSKSLAESFEMFIDIILASIEELGVKVSKKADYTLEDTLKEFN